MPSRQKENADNTEAFQMGEGNSFGFLFRQYYTTLCFFANSIIHDNEEAKDIVQDCFVKLWDSQTINERSETVKSFLYTAVRNKCVDLLRKKKVIQKTKLQAIKNSENDFEYFDEVAFAEMMGHIVNHIELLPPKMQQVIKLYYLEEKNYKEIADTLGTTPETVRNQKGKALKIIRKKLLFLFVIVVLYLKCSGMFFYYFSCN
jgi:RNA polymerase sigma-70 factor (ECF subfamily)